VEGLHFADDEAVFTEVDRALVAAFQLCRGLGHARHPDEQVVHCGREARNLELVHLGGKLRRRRIHRMHRLSIDEVHHELASRVDVDEGVLPSAHLRHVAGKADERQLGAQHGEEAEGRQVGRALAAAGGDPADGPGDDQTGQQAVDRGPIELGGRDGFHRSRVSIGISPA
jgi:hypothetical protein